MSSTLADLDLFFLHQLLVNPLQPTVALNQWFGAAVLMPIFPKREELADSDKKKPNSRLQFSCYSHPRPTSQKRTLLEEGRGFFVS
jgi:hypothetical protein